MTESTIHNCQFEFECPADPTKLRRTNDPSIRFCDHCQRNVYNCSSIVELAHWSRLGECVSLTLRSVATNSIAVGDVVRITSGEFENFDATIYNVNDEDDAAQICMNIFGRHVPFWIEKSKVASLNVNR